MEWINERIGRRIKLADLHVLTATVEAGSMGKAAQRLNTSQPAVSRCIAGLEHDLGVALLERTPRGIEPTAFGRMLLDASAEAFDSLRNGIQQISSANDPTSGAIRIGGQEAIISALLPRIFTKLRKKYPNISVQTSSVGAVPRQYAELRERNLDLIVGRLRPPFEADVEAEILFEERTFVVTADGSPLSRRRQRFQFRELADQPWALPVPGTLVGALFADAFRAHGVGYPPRCFATGTIHLQRALVADAGFLAIIPGSVLHSNAERFGLNVLPVESPVGAAPVGILRLKDKPLMPVVQAFIESLREQRAAFS
jgi:DNA-binding transcriptional LysR family regulator